MKYKLKIGIIISIVFLILGHLIAKNSVSRFSHLELFNKALYLIENQYYRTVEPEKLIQGAIKGMLETLDPHSSFLSKEVFTKMQVETSGEFGGLGIEVTQKDGMIYIITPLDDTPAYKAGIKSGDKIVEIDHESTLGISLDDAVKKMKGKPKTSITLGIMRKGASRIKYFTLMREIIKVTPVKFNLIQDNFAFVRLTQFQKNSANYIFSAIENMRKSIKAPNQLEGLILDLRSNPGGLLDEAVDVSSIFLKEGIVVSTEGRDPKSKEIRYVVKNNKKELELPMVVLINGASASASEIVAGALQDHHRAVIMGSQSFGKGSVQTVAQIDDENGIKLTVAQYLTPKNRRIQAVGIVPDVEIDEVDAAWVKDNRKEVSFIREKDLKNHLNATIETEEEKKSRLIEEDILKKERIEKIKKLEENSKLKKGEKEDKQFNKYDPNNDYQVNMAINFIRGLKAYSKVELNN